jgi:hypothetical protein
MNPSDPTFFKLKRLNKRRQPARATPSGRMEQSVLRPVLMRTEDFLRALREAAHASSASSTQRERKM